AGAAPDRPEIDQDRDGALHHFLLPVVRRQFQHVGAGHRRLPFTWESRALGRLPYYTVPPRSATTTPLGPCLTRRLLRQSPSNPCDPERAHGPGARDAGREDNGGVADAVGP